MFTRDDLFLYFSDRYSESQILQALQELAKASPDIDPDAAEFDASIADQMERTFQLIEAAIASTKQLTGSFDLEKIEQTAINLASDEAIAIPVGAIKGLIEILDAEAAVQAVALFKRREAIRNGVLTQLEVNALTEANEQAAKRMDALQRLCSDPEVLDQVLRDYGLLSNDEAGDRQSKLTDSTSDDFDVDAYLGQVNGAKKPATILDTKNLAKSLVTRSLVR